MPRRPNTKATGSLFEAATINAVWKKARIVPGYDPSLYRKDSCGAWICRTDYGELTDYGWEIDHARPVARGGSDDMTNLQPLHWRNNRHKGDAFPQWSCAVSAAA